jgi:metal-responsive CopG/Arc/MetJ family transcriptional regulator
MKLKTSLTLSEDLLEQVDKLAGPNVSRSSFVERVLRDYVEGRAQVRRQARETAALNRHASKLNAVMEDVASFQADFDE